MKQYRMLFIFIALMLAVSLACNGGGTPLPAPTSTKAPAQPQPPSNNPSSNNPPVSNGNSSDVITVEDQNKLYQFDIPGDWAYSSQDLGNAIYSDVYMYSDTWTSPDGSGVVEGITGLSQGFDFNGSTSTAVALDLLNTYYSYTGKEGDIKISKTSTAQDGSILFEWKSKGGDYSGKSWFEVRGTRTFLMWTIDWGNAADQAILDTLLNAQNSYQPQ
jgi:hypothetical protein